MPYVSKTDSVHSKLAELCLHDEKYSQYFDAYSELLVIEFKRSPNIILVTKRE
jgi:hypothetical protein